MDCSLYIHIPFCKSKCDYCDFFSVPTGNVPDAYVAAVLKEIAYYKRCYHIDKWNTIYIGGGTPSLLSLDQIQKLLHEVYAPDITMEMNPDDITEDLLKVARDSGVTRLSVGIQALSDSALQTVHRRCSRQTSLAGLRHIKTTWSGEFSADMISGLPLQTNDVFLQGLQELASFEPHHISLYSLMLEDETPLGKAVAHNAIVYDYETSDEQWLAGRDFLQSNGWSQYEVSNFAKPGYESRHNMVYWQLQNYIGVGSGATGTIYDVAADAGLRWTNTTSLDTYTSFWIEHSPMTADGRLPDTIQERESLSSDIQEFEFFMMGLRTIRGVSDKEYTRRFKKDITSVLGASTGGLFDRWVHEGRATIFEDSSDEKRYALTPDGLLFLNTFLEELL
ncbi:MAG: radical SAM family heme chaperone HemW [Treponema sp.]|nr:radical SAM family heme chaperone HemW [Treponema sp.]